MTTAISSRIVDHVFCYGLGSFSTDSTAVPASSVQSKFASPGDSNVLGRPHPLDMPYRPHLHFKYTSQIGTTSDMPNIVGLFCFPNGLVPVCSDDIPPPHFHSFVLTDEIGVKRYGICLTFYEKVEGPLKQQLEAAVSEWKEQYVTDSHIEYAQHLRSKLHAEERDPVFARKTHRRNRSDLPSKAMAENDEDAQDYTKLLESQFRPYRHLFSGLDDVYVPMCFGVISCWPFYGVFKDWLYIVWKGVSVSELALEDAIGWLCYDVPLPPNGKVEVEARICDVSLTLRRPPLNSIPLLKNYPLYPLFSCLGLDNTVRLFEFVISESKILFVSSHLSMLTLAAESVTSFLYPLYWQHIYIPVLPANLIQYIHSPVPFIMGIHADYQHLERPPSDVLIVDLDDGTLSYAAPISKRSIMTTALPQAPSLPAGIKRKLMTRLRKLCRIGVTSPQRKVPRIARLPTFLWNGIKKDEAYECKARFSAVEREAKVAYSILMKYVDYLRWLTREGQAASQPNPDHTEGKVLPLPPTVPAASIHQSKKESFDSTNLDKSLPRISTSSLFDEIMNVYDNLALSQSPNAAVHHKSADQSLHIVDDETASFGQRQSLAEVPSQSNVSDSAVSMSGQDKQWTRMESFLSSISGMITRQGATSGDVESCSSSVLSLPSQKEVASLKDSSSGKFFKWLGDSTSALTQSGGPDNEVFMFAPIRFKKAHTRPALLVHIDSLINHAQAPDYLVDFSAVTPEICLVKARHLNDTSISSDKTIEGHDLKRICAALNVGCIVPPGHLPAPPETSSPCPNQIQIGLCGVCHEALTCPLLLADSTTLTTSGIVYVESRKQTRHSHAYACEGCGMIAHERCLNKLVHCCPRAFDDCKVQEAFFRVWTSVLVNYKLHLASNETPRSVPVIRALSNLILRDSRETADYVEPLPGFHGQKFLQQFLDKDVRQFVDALMRTQAFAHFVQDRLEKSATDYEVLLFDECIKARQNKSLVKLSKESTPFLNDLTYDIASRYLCAQIATRPGPAMLKPQDLVAFPRSISVDFIALPKKPKKLVTDEESMRLKIYTHSILRRARIDQVRKKQSTGWIKGKVVRTKLPEAPASLAVPKPFKNTGANGSSSDMRHEINLSIDRIHQDLNALEDAQASNPRLEVSEESIEGQFVDTLDVHKKRLEVILSSMPAETEWPEREDVTTLIQRIDVLLAERRIGTS